MLTEAQVQQSFRKILAVPEICADDLDRAEQLLEKIRPESPLRHRLSEELDQIRQLAEVK